MAQWSTNDSYGHWSNWEASLCPCKSHAKTCLSGGWGRQESFLFLRSVTCWRGGPAVHSQVVRQAQSNIKGWCSQIKGDFFFHGCLDLQPIMFKCFSLLLLLTSSALCLILPSTRLELCLPKAMCWWCPSCREGIRAPVLAPLKLHRVLGVAPS